MDAFSREDLRYLLEMRAPFCVSIYLPTPRLGKDVQPGPIQLKDLLREAESRLLSAGLARSAARSLLAPAQQLLRNSAFWRTQGEGLALFLANGFFRRLRLPLRFPAFVAVSSRFDLAPLLPLWTTEQRFHLLALSRKRTRLYEGSRFFLFESELRSLPAGLAQALEQTVDLSRRQQHTVKPGLPEDLLRYFRLVDRALRQLLKNHFPLLLAAVEDEAALYRTVNSYPHLLAQTLNGNPDRLTPQELHARALPLVEAEYDRRLRAALQQYWERLAPARAATDLLEILPAAHSGRVFHLFVAAGKEKWGLYDELTQTLTVHDTAERGDQELLTLASLYTLIHGGSLFALPPAEMPEGALVAALLRY